MDEPRREEIDADADEPATKSFVKEEIEELAQAVERGFAATASKDDASAVAGQVGALEDRLGRVESAAERILEVVSSIDAKLEGLPERVERLERTAFRRG